MACEALARPLPLRDCACEAMNSMLEGGVPAWCGVRKRACGWQQVLQSLVLAGDLTSGNHSGVAGWGGRWSGERKEEGDVRWEGGREV